MKLSTSLIALLLSANVSHASTLDVYQDKTFYRYVQDSNFIGFAKRVQAKCEGSPLALMTISTCPQEERLCKLLTSVRSGEYKVQEIVSTQKVLEQLISLPQPTTFDAALSILSAQQIGTEQSRLLREKKLLQEEIAIKQKKFNKQATAAQASETSTLCKEELELIIPYGYVTFSTRYEADIQDKKEISVTQYLSILNRSGIDIEAETAMFYYRSASQHVYPTHFSPWLVRKYTPPVPRKRMNTSKKYMQKEMAMPMLSMQSDEVAMPSPIASYEDAREYKIKNLTLPSTGVAIELPVLRWKSALSCELKAYPYTKTEAFHICSFTPKYQIDSNSWKVRSGTKVVNENASGEYRDKKYDIYTKVDEDIKILREAIVLRERETGIFGGTARKKDGFTLTFTNKSDKVKTLTVVERIPTSITDEIKVKLLEVKSDKKINYKIIDNGKIEMKISLAKNETKKIEVLFEISYDKDIKVNY
ncbi:MAG TPA: DUF4139 domain-containing protein [Sulfurovum sp.]|nr:DUF4139 domain-containing protein [Sulfurovum sp.]